MKWFRRWIIKIVLEEIALNGVTLGDKKIFNKDGVLTITEVSNGKH